MGKHHRVFLSDEVPVTDETSPILVKLEPIIEIDAAQALNVRINPPAATVTGDAPAPDLVASEPAVVVELSEVQWLITVTGFAGALGELIGDRPLAIMGGLAGYVWARWMWAQRGPR